MHRLIIAFLVLAMLIPVDQTNAQKLGWGRKRHKTESSNTMIDKKAATEVFIDATKAKIMGDQEKASMLFNRCLEMDPGNDAAMYELAQIYFSNNDFATAARLIEQAIAIDPQNQYYRLLSLDIYGKSGRKEELLKSCQQLVKQYPENVDYKFELATAYLMSAKGDDAIDVYNSIESIMGVVEEVSMQKQRIYMMQNKYEKAASEVQKLLEAFPEDAGRYYSMLAEIYMQANKTDIAAGYYQKVIETDPDNPYVHISLSDYYKKKGDAKRSLEELKAGFSNPSLDVDTKIRVLMTYFSVKEIYDEKKDDALDLSMLMLKASPNDAKALSLNADLLFNDKKYAAARERYRQVLAVDSSRYSVWENLLQTEVSLLDWTSLQMESERAMDLFPFQPIPYFFNGVASIQKKDAAQAIKVLNSGLKLVTDNQALLTQFYTNLGDAYNQTKEYDKSDANYEKVIKQEPDNSYVLNNYAYYLSLRGANLEKALQMAKRGAELDSLNPANLDTYGWVFFKMGNYEQAKTWVGKAILANPIEDPDVLEHYGDIMFKLGDTAKAVEYWNKALNAGATSDLLEKKVKERKLIE
ncbi:MAG: tetratricopeptide repeat protein [Bacteroidetes bacterium]|nr:tetratricopeptide repeat protein [Bacteroidota bacterium]